MYGGINLIVIQLQVCTVTMPIFMTTQKRANHKTAVVPPMVVKQQADLMERRVPDSVHHHQVVSVHRNQMHQALDHLRLALGQFNPEPLHLAHHHLDSVDLNLAHLTALTVLTVLMVLTVQELPDIQACLQFHLVSVYHQAELMFHQLALDSQAHLIHQVITRNFYRLISF